ncbi:integral membrane protein [Pyrenophora tritici-repentis]|nr:integral membrane protein [Pyrenophora tritici-repentis]KAI1685338.1 integral membrane protein [Pyrenophora tritici-repentis]
MVTTTSADPSSTSPVKGGAGAALENQNQSIENFAASLSTAAVIFGVQIAFFLILSGNWKLHKTKPRHADQNDKAVTRQSLYYKTAFVPVAKRISAPVTAIESFKNVFTISDSELVRIAGVDGYLFLQYLQLLLRIFVPMALVILPILLPINRIGDEPEISGLDSFAWPNVGVPEKHNRLWAHLILAVCVIVWVCFNFYLALRQFVRLRQTVLTRPDHRIRASATTILVQSIPKKWLTVAALDALYDVFPGGIKDIWINRDYDELMEKVEKRTKIARALEAAETNLIIACTQKHKKMEEKAAKEAGKKKKTRKEKKQDEAMQNHAINQETHDHGVDAGNPHEIEQQLQKVLEESPSSSSSSSRSSSPDRKRAKLPIAFLGDGMHAVGEGFRDVGEGVDRFNKKVYGGVRGVFVGKQRRVQPQNQEPAKPDGNVDGIDAAIETSPLSADFQQRGASTDTDTPLAKKETFGSDGTASGPNSPKTELKAPAAEEDEQKPANIGWKHPFQTLKAVYVGHGDFVSPKPFQKEGEELPLEVKDPEKTKYNMSGLYDESMEEDGEDALWRKYLRPKDRETMRIPLFNWSWWPSLPLIGKKVDTIYYCRKELARLNAEIADDQAHPERFPLMNSAFIQFNHQVAAHMACQSLSYHIPRQMNPRTVEVNPNYVMWENLTMKWWERYLRMFGVVLIIVGLIIFWGIPVTFTGALSQIETLTDTLHWLRWLETLPGWLLSFIQGVLPPAFLAILFAVLPLILRFLAGVTGTTTLGERELLVQNFYFAFVFVQLFLVVSISTGITATIDTLLQNPTSVPQTLAKNLPKAANYFFSYMILQSLSISSGTLLQIGAVVVIIFLRFLDTTPREKVSRVLQRPGINWGTMIPVYTNFGAIGIIYSVVSPLILIMMLITFSLFWFTYRYQMIYVSYAKAETNGLIFPKAVNQLFTGLYFLELCLVGLFFLQEDTQGRQSCFPHAVIMIIMGIFTVLFQVVLNRAFGPLFTYLPITFEDEAVMRDEEWQRAQASRWEKNNNSEHQSLNSQQDGYWPADEHEQAQRNEQNKQQHESYELSNLDGNIQSAGYAQSPRPNTSRKTSWANRSRRSSHSRSQKKSQKHKDPLDILANTLKKGLDDVAKPIRDAEAQVLPAGNLFDEVDDELADIEPEARQKLIKRSFQHPASRAIQPAVWIPHDELGVAKDEIERTSAFTKRVWITSVNARLDAGGKVIYRGLPPDRDPFENIEV